MESSENLIEEKTFQDAADLLANNFPKLIDLYIKDTRAYLDEMKDGLEQKNLHEVMKSAHTIKSSSMQLGIEKCQRLSSHIEETCRKNENNANFDLAEITPITDELEKTFEQTKSLLKNKLV